MQYLLKAAFAAFFIKQNKSLFSDLFLCQTTNPTFALRQKYLPLSYCPKYIYMRQLLFTVCIAIISFSCGSSDKKEKEPVTIDSNTTIHGDTDSHGPATETPSIASGSTKTVNLTYTGYDEGDYAHLIFTETNTKNDYDFGHPEDNNLNNIQLVIKDEKTTSFGYKENSKMKGAKFVAELIYKMVDTHDEDGQPKKAKEWRIISLMKTE